MLGIALCAADPTLDFIDLFLSPLCFFNLTVMGLLFFLFQVITDFPHIVLPRVAVRSPSLIFDHSGVGLYSEHNTLICRIKIFPEAFEHYLEGYSQRISRVQTKVQAGSHLPLGILSTRCDETP